MSARYIIGDALKVVRTMPDNSVDLILTSPPFLALRSYLPADHPDKQSEMGSERTPGEYLDALLDVVVECRRVLAPHGSLVFELGDTYSGSGGAGGDYSDEGLRAEQPVFDGSAKRTRASGKRTEEESRLGVDARNRARRGGNATVSRGDAWPEAKSLVCIPALFEASLAYGRNLLTGRQIEPWRVRNFCPWVRPNPPVGALGDKFRPATSYLTVACTSRDRWFDLDAVRVPGSRDAGSVPAGGDGSIQPGNTNRFRGKEHQESNPAGAPPLDWFNIPTEPYEGAHYATWPRRLCIPFIKAMCPQKVCRVCGQPSRRIVEKSEKYQAIRDRVQAGEWDESTSYVGATDRGTGTRLANAAARADNFTAAEYETVGWTDCDCPPQTLEDTRTSSTLVDKWRSGVVLDPFAGSGVTLAVATGHGRDAIGIDLDGRNAELALERVGPMFLEIEDHVGTPEVAGGTG